MSPHGAAPRGLKPHHLSVEKQYILITAMYSIKNKRQIKQIRYEFYSTRTYFIYLYIYTYTHIYIYTYYYVVFKLPTAVTHLHKWHKHICIYQTLHVWRERITNPLDLLTDSATQRNPEEPRGNPIADNLPPALYLIKLHTLRLQNCQYYQ